MQVTPSSYDQGARVLLQQDNLITCKWTDLKWLTITDQKIFDIWNAAKKKVQCSNEYSLAKRQIQEVSRRHSDGFLGWLTRCYHRFLNLFGAGITSQQEETLKKTFPEASGASAPKGCLNFAKKLAEGQDLKEFLKQLLESFNKENKSALFWSIRRDPHSSGYNIGFEALNLQLLRTNIKQQLGVDDRFFDDCEFLKAMCWFSASHTRDLVGESRQTDLQLLLEERCWNLSKIKIFSNSEIPNCTFNIENYFKIFGTLNKNENTWSLVMPSKDFDRFQAKIREESNGCIVCPGVGDASDNNLLEIHTLGGGQIQVIFKGRFKNYLEHGEAVPLGEDGEDS